MILKFNEEVRAALADKKPIVALESTVIAHGLPVPQNLETARRLEAIVRENGAVPATVAVFGGEFYAGLTDAQIERLAHDKQIRKISRRDLPLAVARRWDCATTVATTMFVAHRAGIRVFATGGIGGVHRGSLPDVSADLPELAQTPLAVVCSGAKIILDLPATREWLETHGVTVVGYDCDEFPAFYSTKSGLPVDQRVATPGEAAAIISARDGLNLPGSILVTAPVPEAYALDATETEEILKDALLRADQENVRGKEITPFLLGRMAERSGGKTLAANIALLENNARIAARIAAAL